MYCNLLLPLVLKCGSPPVVRKKSTGPGESALPVELPDVPDYAPVSFDPDDAGSEPSPPLGKAVATKPG